MWGKEVSFSKSFGWRISFCVFVIFLMEFGRTKLRGSISRHNIKGARKLACKKEPWHYRQIWYPQMLQPFLWLHAYLCISPEWDTTGSTLVFKDLNKLCFPQFSLLNKLRKNANAQGRNVSLNVLYMQNYMEQTYEVRDMEVIWSPESCNALQVWPKPVTNGVETYHCRWS